MDNVSLQSWEQKFYELVINNFHQTEEAVTVDALFVKMTVSLLDAMKDISPALRKDTRPSTCFVDNMLDGHCTPPTLDRYS